MRFSSEFHFSAVPVLPATGTGKLPKTPTEVPYAAEVAARSPSSIAASALEETLTSFGGTGGNRRNTTGGRSPSLGCSTSETRYGVTSLPRFARRA